MLQDFICTGVLHKTVCKLLNIPSLGLPSKGLIGRFVQGRPAHIVIDQSVFFELVFLADVGVAEYDVRQFNRGESIQQVFIMHAGQDHAVHRPLIGNQTRQLQLLRDVSAAYL